MRHFYISDPHILFKIDLWLCNFSATFHFFQMANGFLRKFYEKSVRSVSSERFGVVIW